MKHMDTKEILNIMPNTIKSQIANIDKLSKVQEIRLRIGKPLILQVDNNEVIKPYTVAQEDIKSIVQRISNYSVYAFEEEIKQGYITIKGGHRVGICGDCVIENGRIKTIKNISSLNIRICREVIGCSNKLLPYISSKGEILNTIIISPPKCGKTTLLRDMVRNISQGVLSERLTGKKVVVIDERSEIAACYEGIPQMDVGIRTDVYDNCIKSEGIMIAIRSMAPDLIICDEIGTKKDMESVIAALNSGVNLITTIHGFGVEDMYERYLFKELIENNVFKRAIVLSNSKGVGTVDYIFDFKLKTAIWGNKND